MRAPASRKEELRSNELCSPRRGALDRNDLQNAQEGTGSYPPTVPVRTLFGRECTVTPRPQEVWRTDPATLRDIVLDVPAMEARLTQCLELERVWILGLLDRTSEAITEGQRLLASSSDRLRPLLVLARAYQRQYSWHEAARLQEEALCLSGTSAREALVRRQIGHRLFDEARYREAAAEFEWARDLYRSLGRREHIVRACQQALDRSRELADRQAGLHTTSTGLLAPQTTTLVI